MKTLVIWLVCILFLSVMPAPEVEVDLPSADKLLHVILYGITCVLIYTVLRESRPKASSGALILVSMALSFGYGFLMEVAQTYTATRSFSRLDLVANLLGSLLGAAYIKRKTGRLRHKGG
jgi:VanZ family protein